MNAKRKERRAKKEKRTAEVVQLPPPAQRPMKIAYEAIGAVRARRAPEPLYTTSTQFDPDVFRPAKPPPGVVPTNVKPMAMDEDFGAAWGGYGARSENLNWLGYPFLAELSQRAEYRQITETLAKEATRKWIRVIATGDGDKSEKVARIEKVLKRHRVREKFRRLAELDGFYGRGHLFVDTGDTSDREILKTALVLDERLNGPGFLRGFRVVEPTWSYPGVYNSADPLAEDFYRPHTWYVFGKEVHRTRFLTLISREVPDILKPAYSFGGISMSQLARPYIDNWLRTRQSVSDLVHSFSVSGIKTDMSSVLIGGGSEQLMSRADLFSEMRDNLGTMLLDKDREEFFNVSTPLGTLDHLQAQAQEQMAAVSHTPLIVLLGITPSGLNASSDGELQVWASWVRSYQEHLFDEPLQFVIRAIQMDEWGEIDRDIDFEYEPLREMSEEEAAAARKTDADVDVAYVNGGILSPDEIRQKLAADPETPYAGIDLSAPAPEPPPDADPLAGAPDGMAGGPEEPTDALGRLAAAVSARRRRRSEARDDGAYEHWWEATSPSPLDRLATAIADLHDPPPPVAGGGQYVAPLAEAPAEEE